MINSRVRSEVKKVVSQIETLASRVRTALDAGADVMASANELVANTVTLTFSVGELYALENAPGGVNTGTVTPAQSNHSQSRYHNVRDSRGRFTTVSSRP